MGVADGFKLREVKAYTASDYTTGELDVTSHFNFDNGQKDNLYGHARIVKKSSSSLNLGTYQWLVAKFDYFTHTISGPTFACIDSYPVDDTGATGIKTEEIPVYKSEISGDFPLRDSIDFRPYVTDTSSPNTVVGSAPENPSELQQINRPSGGLTNPVPSEEFTTDLEYYRGRGARVVLDHDGEFRVVLSEFADNPKLPALPEKCMELAKFILPAYPCLSPHAARNANRPEYGINIKQADNRRYTMRDIGALERRISNLEYYTTLSILEKQANELSILDSTGLDRFKNGILVDSFTGHNIGAVSDQDYHIAIDPKAQELRPYFYSENIELKLNSTSSGVSKSGDIVHLPYDIQPFTSNYQASKYKNLVTDLLFTWTGNVELDPPVDNFVDTTTRPAVQANFEGNFDAWENMADAWGTQWGAWEDVGAAQVTREDVSVDRQVAGGTGGSDTFTTVTTTQKQQSVGTSISVSDGGFESQSLGNKVVSTAIVPFMRQLAVRFTATRLKPNTRVYPFFDGQAVSEHCRADYNNLGGELVTDVNGDIAGYFVIPAGEFRTGARNFRLVDEPNNNEKVITTVAEALFQSSGLHQEVQDTIVSMRTAQVVTNRATKDKINPLLIFIYQLN